MLRKKYSVAVATVTVATLATHEGEKRAIEVGNGATVAKVATVTVANPMEAEITSPVGRDDVDVTDDRRFCTQCGNLRGDVCTVASPGGLVSAIVGYRPVLDILHRCVGYSPTDQAHRPTKGIDDGNQGTEEAGNAG